MKISPISNRARPPITSLADRTPTKRVSFVARGEAVAILEAAVKAGITKTDLLNELLEQHGQNVLEDILERRLEVIQLANPANRIPGKILGASKPS